VTPERVLAIDVRPKSFGFAVLEEQCGILDWGARSFRRGMNRGQLPFGSGILQVMDQFAPSVLVLKTPRTKRIARLVEGIRTRAKRHKVTVRVLSPKLLDRTFTGHNANKYQIATSVAEKFPELLPMLPPKRRPWQSEDYRMSIFDAGAVGIAYIENKVPARR
jgi:hypothetical protein